MQAIAKLCADSLRAISKEKYDVRLKPTHAHELVSAFWGYKSRNSMLADIDYPIDNLINAEIIVMISDEFIDMRRQSLNGLSQELPNSYELGEAVYSALFNDTWWSSSYPPFKSFEKLARYIIDNDESHKYALRLYRDILIDPIVSVEQGKTEVILTVLHCHKSAEGDTIVDFQSTIKLPRVAGRIGFGKAHIHIEKLTGGARQTLKTSEVAQ